MAGQTERAGGCDGADHREQFDISNLAVVSIEDNPPQIIEGRMPVGALSRRVMNGFYRERAGDVWIITKPFSFVSEGIATTHGSPYSYDTHVPVIFFGAGVRAGRYYNECSPADIAPTVAAMLGVEPPSGSVGRVLVEAIANSNQKQDIGQR